MEIRQLYYVVEIAKHNSFSKAAEALYITQPTISHQINTLEKELQTKLFVRNTHKVELTLNGKLFCSHAQKIINEIEILYRHFEKEPNIGKIHIRIGLFPFYRSVGLGHMINAYFREYTDVVGSMETMENYKAFRMLRQNQLDFAVLKSPSDITEEDIACKILTKERISVLISRSNPHAAKSSLTMEDIGQLSLLTGEKDSHFYNGMKKLCNEHGVNFNVAFYNTNEIEMMIDMIRDDIGILLASDSVCRNYEDDKIIMKELRPAQEMITFLAYLKDKKMHSAHNQFKEYILQQYSKNENQ